MQPEAPSPVFGQEHAAPAETIISAEQTAELPGVETGIIAGAEHFEQRSERVGMPTDPMAAVQQSVILPAPVAPVQDDVSTSVVGDDMPVVAADEDLIEKEWVDKAKKIIDQTKDDPYKREKAVGELQKDYLKKRYGKEIGTS